jgi:hypothetical protein
MMAETEIIVVSSYLFLKKALPTTPPAETKASMQITANIKITSNKTLYKISTYSMQKYINLFFLLFQYQTKSRKLLFFY